MAITTIVSDVVCLAPELEGQDTRILKMIENAKLSVSESVWGTKANLATALLTAHMMTVFSRGGIGGEIKRKKLGDAEVEFSISSNNTITGDMHELTTTSYGKEYLRCRRTLSLSPILTGC